MNKQKEVIKYLLTDIVGIKKSDIKKFGCNGSVIFNDNKIFTNQIIKRNFDPDISNITMGYYKIVFRDIIGKDCLINDDAIYNYSLAGDTMNSLGSFYYILQKHKGDVIEKKYEELKSMYHCLANFWLLPVKIGRKSKKFLDGSSGVNDFMDRYLKHLKENENNIFGKKSKCIDCDVKNFFSRFDDFDEYIKKMCIENYIYDKNNGVRMYSIDKNNNLLNSKSSNEDIVFAIETMIENIKNRAYLLAEKFTDELYNYFSKDIEVIK